MNGMLPNPIPKFYRPNPEVFSFLVDRILKPTELRVMLELMLAMDTDNCFEPPEGETVREYMEKRFSLHKDDVNKILKRLKTLGIITNIKNSPKLLRINPWIANKTQKFSSMWEFEDIKLSPLIAAGLHDWFMDKGLMSVRTLSRQRIKHYKNIKQLNPDERQRLQSLIEQLEADNRNLIETHIRDTEKHLLQRQEDEMMEANTRQHEETRKVMAEFFDKLMKKTGVPDDLKKDARKTMFKVLSGGKDHHG